MKKLFFLAIALIWFQRGFTSHLRGGQITIHPINCISNEYELVLTIYFNTSSQVQPGGGTLDFGDGKSLVVTNGSFSTLDTVNEVGQFTFSTIHMYSLPGNYTVSYIENNRNNGVLNFSNSGSTPFYIESYFLIDPLTCTRQTLYFEIPPIDRACSRLAFTYNPGAVVPVGDSVSYEFATPLQGKDELVVGYQDPNSTNFYSTNYQSSNEGGTGSPIYKIGQDGTLIWDAPGFIGEYTIAIKVFQWTVIDGVWVSIAWVERDMQIIVEDCGATRPYLIVPADLCIQAGTSSQQIIRGYDKDFSKVEIEVIQLENLNSEAPKFINTLLLQSTASPNDTANIKVTWTPTCDLVRTQPYKFVFKISSYTKDGIRISSYQTWNVKVTGPPPTYQSLSLNLATKKLNIQWNNYLCANAPTIQIWRRVDRDLSQNDPCQIGIPKSWGFTKIGEVTNNTFIDNNLSPGATYCYRLLAIYTSPYQTMSITSKDTCIGPIVADAPVITNVSVVNTDKSNGGILTKWTSPFQINKALFPSPYQYEVFRTTNGNTFKQVTAKINDTTFVDSNLDVTDSLYGYKIVVYSPGSIAQDNPIDTSALAFYPRLASQSVKDTIKLFWSTKVPWSNQDFRFPWHFIYRKELGAISYALMDSVNALTVENLEYFDFGGKKGFPIQNNIAYQYKIETQGAYGNPHIKEPLQNFSNEIMAQPVDKTPPCTPSLEISSVACETLINSPCTINTFPNRLSWNYSTDCGNDIAYYKVFFSASQDADTTLLITTSNLSYIDQKQNSMAGCYQVLAVDRSGNVGKPSIPICVENCVNVFIPNLITVNNDGLNETFPGLSDVSDIREPYKCPRFVKEFSLRVYNRWGEEVFAVNNSGIGQPNSEWKGLDQKGQELPVGVYYYSVNVFFYSLNTKLQNQKIKGWISLIR